MSAHANGLRPPRRRPLAGESYRGGAGNQRAREIHRLFDFPVPLDTARANARRGGRMLAQWDWHFSASSARPRRAPR